MGTGRNETCPCGSGKKYKKCCLNKIDEPQGDYSPHYFQLKGKNAEQVLHGLAEKTFFTDWCFLNPKLPDGKELCDLLVVFDDIAIVWQIKNLKLDENGHYKTGEKEKNLSQLYGAKRSLFDLKRPIELENARRIKEKFDPSTIKQTYYISALIGEGEWSYIPTENYKGMYINVLSGRTLEIMLAELDTIGDFTTYLKAKKDFYTKTKTSVVITGGEEDFMAYWLMEERSFKKYEKADMLFLNGGAWEHFSKRDDYLRKKEADRISYGWYNLINRAHEGSEKYERVARELARPDRFKRRILAQAFYDAYKISHESDKYTLYRRVMPDDDVTYCFLFMDAQQSNRKDRISMLTAFCMVCRIKFGKSKVIGVATGKKIRRISAYDYCLMDIPTVTEKFKEDAERIQKELGILVNPSQVEVHEDEYPAKQ